MSGTTDILKLIPILASIWDTVNTLKGQMEQIQTEVTPEVWAQIKGDYEASSQAFRDSVHTP